MVEANSTCLRVRLPSGFSLSSLASRSSELSGVRSSCDMLVRNSDLYFEDRASCSARSSSAPRASSTSRFLISRRRERSSSSSFVCWSSSCWLWSSSDRLWSSRARDCDCSSSSSVRVFARIVFRTTPIVSPSCSRKVRWMSRNGSSAASSITAITRSSPPSIDDVRPGRAPAGAGQQQPDEERALAQRLRRRLGVARPRGTRSR